MKIDWSFRPKLAVTLKNYSRQDLVADLIAGLTVVMGAGLFAPTFIPAGRRATRMIFTFMPRTPIAAHPV